MVGSYLGAWTRFRLDLGVDHSSPFDLSSPRHSRKIPRPGKFQTHCSWDAVGLGPGAPASVFSHCFGVRTVVPPACSFVFALRLFLRQVRRCSQGRWQGCREFRLRR